MLFTVACTLHFYCNWAIACTCCWARHQGLAQISNCCDRLRPRSWLPLSAPFPLWVAWIKYIFSQCASIRSCHIIDQLDSIECKMNKINQTSSQHVQAISKKVSMLNQSQDKCKAIICCPKERGATVSWVHPRASWVVEPQHHRAAWWEGLGCGAWAREGGLYDWDWGLRSGVWGGWEVWGGEGGEQWGADVGWGRGAVWWAGGWGSIAMANGDSSSSSCSSEAFDTWGGFANASTSADSPSAWCDNAISSVAACWNTGEDATGASANTTLADEEAFGGEGGGELHWWWCGFQFDQESGDEKWEEGEEKERCDLSQK